MTHKSTTEKSGIGVDLQDVIKRKYSEKALRLNKENLQLIINSSPVAICTADTRGNFVMTNHAYEQMLGYTKAELSTLSIFEVTHPDDLPENKELFQKMFSLKSTCFSMEKKYIRKDGSIIDVEVHATGVKDAKGRIKFGTAFVRDITQYKHAEKKLKRNQKMFSDIVSAIPDLLWLKDGDGVYLTCNREFEKLLKTSKDNIIGRTDYDLFPKEKADFYAKHDALAVQRKTTVINEESADYVHDDYSIWIETTKTPVYSDEGQLIGILGIGRDISRKREALQESQEKQDFLNQVVHKSQVPMYITSPNGTALICNRALRDLWKLPKEASIATYSLAEDANLNSPEISNKITLAKTEKRPVRFEVYWDPKKVQGTALDKTECVWLDISLFPLLNAEKTITHLVVQMMDITHQKKIVEELASHQATLESEVFERTKELRQFVNVMADRENRMAELKQIIKGLHTQLEDAGIIPIHSIAQEIADAETSQEKGTAHFDNFKK